MGILTNIKNMFGSRAIRRKNSHSQGNPPAANTRRKQFYKQPRFFRTAFAGIFLVFALLLTIHSGDPYVSHKNLKTIPIDNEFIQTFRGRIGRWVKFQKNKFQPELSALGSSLNEVRELNGFSPSNGNYVFIPMSAEVYNELLEKGLGRRIVEFDKRKMIWPVEIPSYTSRFGHRRKGMHLGLDMGCARGTVVVASSDGVVKVSARMGGMGKAINILHDDGLDTWYGHNNVLLVQEGERVNRGQIIAFSGNTGRSTGPHLHFEIRYMNIHLDPEDFLPFAIRNPDLVARETPGKGFGVISESAFLMDSSRETH